MRLALTGRVSGRKLQWLKSLGQLGAMLRLPVFLAGGPVRDLLLGRQELDVDIAIEGNALAYGEALAARDGARVSPHPDFGSATVHYPDGRHVDLTGTRREHYPHPGALPVITPTSMREDLSRRDFTVNAMALSLSPDNFGELMDPFDGYRHLRHGVLMALHADSFADDPTRILRASRFAARLSLRLDEDTDQWIRTSVLDGALQTVSRNRLVTELRYLLTEPSARWALWWLGRWHALEWLWFDTTRQHWPLLDSIVLAQQELGINADESTIFAAALSLVLGARLTREWVARWPLLHEEKRGALQAADLLEAEICADFPSGAERSRIYTELCHLPPAALLAGWAAGSPVVRSNLGLYCRDLMGATCDVCGKDLLNLGYKPGPGYTPALDAAMAVKLDVDADRSGQLNAAAEVLRQYPSKPQRPKR